MNIKFDKETDVVYLRFSDAEIVESDEEKPGIIIDYDESGAVGGIELLDASIKMKKPGSLVYEVE
jgi:uncharacterized protein YuzE